MHPFPTRLLALPAEEPRNATKPAQSTDPGRINQHIEGLPDGHRAMTTEEVERLLGDPFATLVLRAGRFPANLTELLDALDTHDAAPVGLPQQSSFAISEGGQIRFRDGVAKGGTRLITVRSRRGSPELMISTLIAQGGDPRADTVLNEVLAWDPPNRTFHFYQRQRGMWFWCGQSDMALEDATRGKGPFDSHVNGYPLMKELKTPWVHWSGPGVRITEAAYAPDDPLVRDPLFTGHRLAFEFEFSVIRPLIARWNTARFDKAMQAGMLTAASRFLAQVLDATTANLVSTHREWTQLPAADLDDLPVSFFYDHDCLAGEIGLPVTPPPLVMSGRRYHELAKHHDLRVRGGSVDEPGDVPFCFTVPERAFEDVIVTEELIRRGAMSRRLAACLLMVDFPNPVGSVRRAALLRHVPATVGLNPGTDLDAVLVPMLLAAAAAGPDGTPEREFAEHWDLGPDEWTEAFTERISGYLGRVQGALGTDTGCDEIYRLAESRRREFSRRPLAEFDLTLPQSVGIPATAPALDMTEQATVRPRHNS